MQTSASEPQGTTALWIAASGEQWDLIEKMLKRCHSQADINTSHVEGRSRGKTPLWFAAFNEQWNLVEKMLACCPQADVNAASAEGPNKGTTPLWLAAYDEQWDLVEKMLECCSQAGINAVCMAGPNEGATVLWLLAVNKQWGLVKKMLNHQGNLNITETHSVLNEALMHMEKNPLAADVAYFAALSFRGAESLEKRLLPLQQHIESSLERTITLINTQRDDHRANPILSLPAELQRLVILEVLRTDCTHLAWLDDYILLEEIKLYTARFNESSLKKAKEFIALLTLKGIEGQNPWVSFKGKSTENFVLLISKLCNHLKQPYLAALRAKIVKGLVDKRVFYLSKKEIADCINESVQD